MNHVILREAWSFVGVVQGGGGCRCPVLEDVSPDTPHFPDTGHFPDTALLLPTRKSFGTAGLASRFSMCTHITHILPGGDAPTPTFRSFRF